MEHIAKPDTKGRNDITGAICPNCKKDSIALGLMCPDKNGKFEHIALYCVYCEWSIRYQPDATGFWERIVECKGVEQNGKIQTT